MATDVLTLKTSFRKRVGSPSYTALPDAEAIAYVNKGYQHTLDTFAHPVSRQEVTFTTVSGTATYDLPRSARSLLRLWNKSFGKRLYKVGDIFAYEWRNGDQTESLGMPLKYFKSGPTIRLYPTPKDAYEIVAFCKVKIDDLVLDTDEVIIDDWDDIIIARAVYSYYLDIGDEPKAKWAIAVWKEATNNKPTQMEEESVDYEIPVQAATQYQNGGMSGFRRYTSDPWGAGL